MKNLDTEQFWYVKQMHVFRDLSETDARALTQIVTFKDLKHEERISEEGVYLIKEGRVKISKNLSDANTKKIEDRSVNSDSGEDQETKEVLESGEIFGIISEDAEISDQNRATFAETLTEVCIGIVANRDFMFFLKRKPHLALPLPRKRQPSFSNVFGVSTNSFLEYRNKKQTGRLNSHNILKTSVVPNCKRANLFRNIMFRCTSSRLALLLQNLALVPDSKGIVLVPRLSIKRMSKLIGSSTETIEILLKTFKQHNIIDTRRRQIQILNPWQLKKIADARMKTLSPLQVPATTSDDDLDFETLTGLRAVDNNQTSSTASST
ncbi:MAG: helix-turn-helix domain-containing protein [Candidatus Poribacteria bacterium]|nr:helix-turn-helix domain-containing protein [Candidatus Poribacteria bacterium]